MSRESNGRLSADIMEYLGTEGWDNTVDLALQRAGSFNAAAPGPGSRAWFRAL
jgi:hypothetical protein